MGPEDKFKKQILREVCAMGGWWYATPRSAYTRAGIPDILGCFHGAFIGVEVKRPDGKRNYGATPSQMRVINDINLHGGVALVVDSEESLQELKDSLNAIARSDC